jgi:hypothetical protein
MNRLENIKVENDLWIKNKILQNIIYKLNKPK